MSDDFESFLAASLVPPERPEDFDFARRVQRRIRLDGLERVSRRRALRGFAIQLAGLAGLGAGLLVAGRSGPAIALAESAPNLLLGGLLFLLAGWCWIVVGQDNRGISVA